MKTKHLSFIAVIFVIFASCTKDTIKPNVAPVIPTGTTIKFSTDVYPIFTSAYGCVNCHDESNDLNLTGTASVVRTKLLTTGAVVADSSASSKLYTYFHGAIHKNKTLTSTEVSNIKAWIDAGALDN